MYLSFNSLSADL